MRRIASITMALGALLITGAASAAGGSDKTPGKGAAGPSSSSSASEGPGGGKEQNLSDTRDRVTDTTFSAKVWEVGAGFEYHHSGLDGGYITNGAARNVNYYSLFGRWDASPYDRLQVSWGVYQWFLSDQGEPGVRADDISFKYTRRIPLPGAVTMRASFSLTAPVSYGSQVATLYTAPKLQLQADRRFGKFFSLDARLSGGFYVVKYAEGSAAFTNGGNSGFSNIGTTTGNTGSNPNPRGTFSMALNADLAMPFHDALSVGLSVYTGWTWFYDVCNGAGTGAMTGLGSALGMPAGMTACSLPVSGQPGGQPFQQSYAGEIYVRYALPVFGGFKSDVSFAFAPNGDPTMGYAPYMHDTGVGHAYPFYYRETAEVYFGLTGRY
jgi:hypothetical protein